MGFPKDLSAAEQKSYSTLSPYQLKFLDFAARHPECLDIKNFPWCPLGWTAEGPQHLVGDDIPTQAWPSLISPEITQELSRLSVGVLDLICSIPQRIFANDPARICDFYGLGAESAGPIAKILNLPWRPGGELMRGDFIFSGDKFFCIEANAVINIGGLYNFYRTNSYLQMDWLRRFFAEEQVEVRFRNPLQTFLSFVVSRATARALHRQGFLNLAIMIEAAHEFDIVLPMIEPTYQALLAKHDVVGKVIFCEDPQLAYRDGEVKVGQDPVHILVQYYDFFLYQPVSPLIEAWIDGVIDLYPGPMGSIYTDKRNFAMLSAELPELGLSASEKSLVADHLPWTRFLQPGQTTYQGENVDLVAWVTRHRERFVLKPGLGFSGAGISIGHFMSDTEWQDAVQTALAYESYIVQEYIAPYLTLNLHPDHGLSPFQANWGLFVFGQQFGGAFIRIMPAEITKLISIGHGARASVLLEIVPPGQPVVADDHDLCWSFAPGG